MYNRLSNVRQSNVHRQSLPADRTLVRTLFGRRWWWKTLVVLAAMGVFLRLAVWQMDRLEQRRARNAETRRLVASPPIDLNAEALPVDPSGLRYRHAVARGEYDFAQQVALELQNWNGMPGLHLLAPLVLDGGHEAVLVDRGWIPYEDLAPERWSQFDEPGVVSVTGSLQTPQRLPGGALSVPQRTWYRVDLAAIQAQMPYHLLPVYLLQSPDAEGNQALPYHEEPNIDLSNGPHLNYALQWLSFAMILGGGYVWFVADRTKKSKESK
jgi:surfeit locus 1 family protein